MQHLLCSIDGGQTSTKCVITTNTGEVLGQGRGGPLVHLSAQGGKERFTTAMRHALQSAWQSAQLAAQPIAALVLGATGIEANSVEAATARSLLAPLVEAAQVEICSDGLIALYGAHAGDPGVIVIAGTGTIALGMDETGSIQRVGGWGWIIDDEGSAFGMGRAGLRAALRAYDGRGEATQLTQRFLEHFAVAAYEDVKRIVYAHDYGSAGYASLAGIVSLAAEAGDAVAQRIIHEAGSELALEAIATIRLLHFRNHPIPVSPMSGAFDHISGLRQAFTTALEQANVAAIVRPPQLSALMGGVLMGKKLVTG